MTSPGESQNQSEPAPGQGDPTTASVPFVTKAFASGLFSGFSPAASGTVGSAVALALYFIPGFELSCVLLPLCAVVFFLGVKASDAMENVYGHDPAEVTIDEMLGMWISLLFLPKTLPVAGAAFFIFRILDIVKPFPARRLDNMKGGLGIMLDDVVSGVYTNLILQLVVATRILH
jgi:phosphatidylglycerophosphatase A